MAQTNNQEQCFHSMSANDRTTMKKKDRDITCGGMGTTERPVQTRKQTASNDDEESSSSTQQLQRRNQLSANNSKDQEISRRNKKKTHECKKGVRISKQIAIGFTISRLDMSPDEKSWVWYSEEEYVNITQACLKQIQKLDNGEILKDKKYCARGLENKMHIASIAQAMHRNLAYKVVFQEQDRQRREGVREPECIASLYRSVSSSSQLWANVIALKDQRLAKAANEENKKCRQWNNKSHSCMDRGASSRTSARLPSRVRGTIELAMAA